MAKKDKNPKMQKTGQNTDQTAKMPKRENWKDQKDMKLKTNKTAADAVTIDMWLIHNRSIIDMIDIQSIIKL